MNRIFEILISLGILATITTLCAWVILNLIGKHISLKDIRPDMSVPKE